MTIRPALSLAIIAVLALGGCGKGKAPEHAAAAGEVLPRSASDDMLPYDTVRSQPELSNPDAGRTGGTSSHPRAEASGEAEENADVVNPPAAVPETPAAAPAAE